MFWKTRMAREEITDPEIPEDQPPAYTPNPQSQPPSSGAAVVAGTVPAPLPPPGPSHLPPHFDPNSKSLPPIVGANEEAPVPPRPRPTNFILLNRKDTPIKGTHVINPSLRIASAMLQNFVDQAGERANFAASVENGDIDVDLWLVDNGSVSGDKESKANLSLKINNRHTTCDLVARIHRPGSAFPRFTLKASSNTGLVAIHLPRSYRGYLKITGHSNEVSFSEALIDEVTPSGETEDATLHFIGDMEEGEHDEVEIYAHDAFVMIQYVDGDIGVTAPKSMPNVFFNVALGNVYGGRLVFRLYDDTVPSLTMNFRELASGGREGSLKYEGARFFHRNAACCYGGDCRSSSSSSPKNEEVVLKRGTLCVWPEFSKSDSRFLISNKDQKCRSVTIIGEVIEGFDLLDKLCIDRSFRAQKVAIISRAGITET